ncbi:hypothetical protein JCM8097_001147 [Rhodosporidiobolus ruineniae]
MPRPRPSRGNKPWTTKEDEDLLTAYDVLGPRWPLIADAIDGSRTAAACSTHYRLLLGKKEEEEAREAGGEVDWGEEDDRLLLDEHKKAREHGNGHLDWVRTCAELANGSTPYSAKKRLSELLKEAKLRAKEKRPERIAKGTAAASSSAKHRNPSKSVRFRSLSPSLDDDDGSVVVVGGGAGGSNQAKDKDKGKGKAVEGGPGPSTAANRKRAASSTGIGVGGRLAKKAAVALTEFAQWAEASEVFDGEDDEEEPAVAADVEPMQQDGEEGRA